MTDAEARAMTDQPAAPPWAARTYDPTWRCCRVIDHHNSCTVCHVFGKPKTALIRAKLFAAAPETAAERDRLKAWVDDLQSGMYVNCVYCGHRYGPGETTPVSMADALKEHIEQCSEHPMSRLKVVNEGLADALEKMMVGIYAMREGDVPPLELWQELWDEARAALDEARK